ncbi:unnamed protein product [Fasciola hepatica]|uniref:Uncharacterized protein n=1 Tax=Fasciola hepatica TaxID=6192 RepID=A0ABC9HF80_FASHE
MVGWKQRALPGSVAWASTKASNVLPGFQHSSGGLSKIVSSTPVGPFLQIPLAFVRAASTDPGILPRATKPEANRGKYQKLPGDLFVDGLENHRVKRFTTAKCATLSDRSACAQNSDVGSRGQIEFYHACRFFRPPRASPYSVCD